MGDGETRFQVLLEGCRRKSIRREAG